MADLRFLPDPDALVAALPGDAPGGDKGVFATLKDKVEENRRDIDPDMYGADDPQRPKEFKPANWAAVLSLCLPALEARAKDLRIARWVVDALPRRAEADRVRGRYAPGGPPPAGFAALADGLTLLHRLTADGWDYLLPAFDPDEPDGRNGPYDWLGDADTGAYLPEFVRTLPVAVTPDGPVTRRAWDGSTGDERAALTRAAAAADPAELLAVLADLDRGRAELVSLLAVLGDKLGDAAPGMTGLKLALDDCHALAAGLLAEQDAGAAPDPPPDDAPPDPPLADGVAAPGNAPAKPVATREGAYKALREAALLLQKLEPHSPVPFLVLRAVELGGKPFPEMIKSFVRDEAILTELRRELAITDDPPAE